MQTGQGLGRVTARPFEDCWGGLCRNGWSTFSGVEETEELERMFWVKLSMEELQDRDCLLLCFLP